jgi:helix-destabilizing protein
MSGNLSVVVEVRSKQLNRVEEWKGKHYGEQGAAMYNGGDFPTPIKVRVEQGHEYEPGQYVFDPASFIADEMGNPKLKRVKLLPIGGAKLAGK